MAPDVFSGCYRVRECLTIVWIFRTSSWRKQGRCSLIMSRAGSCVLWRHDGYRFGSQEIKWWALSFSLTTSRTDKTDSLVVSLPSQCWARTFLFVAGISRYPATKISDAQMNILFLCFIAIVYEPDEDFVVAPVWSYVIQDHIWCFNWLWSPTLLVRLLIPVCSKVIVLVVIIAHFSTCDLLLNTRCETFVFSRFVIPEGGLPYDEPMNYSNQAQPPNMCVWM